VNPPPNFVHPVTTFLGYVVGTMVLLHGIRKLQSTRPVPESAPFYPGGKRYRVIDVQADPATHKVTYTLEVDH